MYLAMSFCDDHGMHKVPTSRRDFPLDLHQGVLPSQATNDRLMTMYSPSSSSSVSSADSYDRRRHRRPRRSKRDDTGLSKVANHMSPILIGLGSDVVLSRLTSNENPRRRKSAAKANESTVSREDESRIQNEIRKQQLEFLIRKESSLLNGIEEGKRKLERQHEKEVAKLLNALETELVYVTDKYHKKQEDLEVRLEMTHAEAREELKRCKQHYLALERELESTKANSMYETRKLQGELRYSIRQTLLIKDEAQKLKENHSEKDEFIRKLQEELSNSMMWASTMKDENQKLIEQLVEKDEYIRRLERSTAKLTLHGNAVERRRKKVDEIRGRGGANARTNEEIQVITSRNALLQEEVESMNTWEVASGLTSSFDSFVRKEHPELARVKSPDPGTKKYHSSPNQHDYRDDLNSRKLSVMFSDETTQRFLPMQAHDRLLSRLRNEIHSINTS